MNTTVTETTIVKTQTIVGLLKRLDVTISHKYGNSQVHVARKRRVPRLYTRSIGWVTEAIDNNDQNAATIGGRVYTPATAVRLSFRVNGYSNWTERAELQATIVYDALIAAGYNVEKKSTTYFVITK